MTRADWLTAIGTTSTDPALRRAYADWLEEQGEWTDLLEAARQRGFAAGIDLVREQLDRNPPAEEEQAYRLTRAFEEIPPPAQPWRSRPVGPDYPGPWVVTPDPPEIYTAPPDPRTHFVRSATGEGVTRDTMGDSSP